jgi:hypothetical protein
MAMYAAGRMKLSNRKISKTSIILDDAGFFN